MKKGHFGSFLGSFLGGYRKHVILCAFMFYRRISGGSEGKVPKKGSFLGCFWVQKWGQKGVIFGVFLGGTHISEGVF